ncbi:MAG: hypothetical protein ACYSSI_13335, partial [Planctomycetota bacterium]
DITIKVDSDLPITDSTFADKFKQFEVDGPGKDTISIRHYFELPDLNGRDFGKEIYHKSPWSIYKKGDSWIYLGISPVSEDMGFDRIAVFNHDYTSARIYNKHREAFTRGPLHSLTLFPTDQILLARLLADREGCYLHSSGVILDGKGLLFVGHSEAGKTTIAKLFKHKAKVLCDDRIILRRQAEGLRIYGTWNHGDLAEVSNESAPLKAILFLHKAEENRIELIKDKIEINKRLLACLVRPLVTVEWWKNMLSLVEKVTDKIQCYLLYFDKSDKVVNLLKDL